LVDVVPYPVHLVAKVGDAVGNTFLLYRFPVQDKLSQKRSDRLRLITVVSSSAKQDKNRRFCVVTKLNISMQKTDSILLSHTGLKYYYETDKKIFNEVKNKYLSTLWIDADYETQIKEIAHNIRNRRSNNTKRIRQKYNARQTQLF